MRIERQKPAAKMLSCAAQLALGDLKTPGLLNGVAFEQFMNGGIGRNKGQPIGQLEAFLGKSATMAVLTVAKGLRVF